MTVAALLLESLGLAWDDSSDVECRLRWVVYVGSTIIRVAIGECDKRSGAWGRYNRVPRLHETSQGSSLVPVSTHNDVGHAFPNDTLAGHIMHGSRSLSCEEQDDCVKRDSSSMMGCSMYAYIKT